MCRSRQHLESPWKVDRHSCRRSSVLIPERETYHFDFPTIIQIPAQKGVRTLRSSVDVLPQREREKPDDFATAGLILPAVLTGLRDKSKRPIDVFLRPDDLTWRQRDDMIRSIDTEARRMQGVLRDNPEDDAVYYACVCLNWMELLHQVYFRAADMPDVLPELTIQVKEDMSDLVFRALDDGSNKIDNLSQTTDDRRQTKTKPCTDRNVCRGSKAHDPPWQTGSDLG